MVDKLNQRSDKFTIVLNDNEVNLFKDSETIVNKLITDVDVGVSYIACIKHDRDIDEELQHVKTLHYHVVLELDSICRVGTVLKWLCNKFHCNENQVSIDKCNSLAMQSRYLLHLDDIDKVRYYETEVSTNNIFRFKDYLTLVKIKDMKDLIARVKEYHYDIEIIMSKIVNYDKYRKYINDIIVNYYRRNRNY